MALFDAVSKLPLAAFSYGTPQPAPALGAARVAEIGPQAWVSKVSGSYELAGFDTNPRSFEAYFTVVHRAAGWRLADDSDGGTQPQIWDIPGFTVLRSPTTLVVGEGPASRLRPYLALGDTAVPRVSRVWGTRWNAHVVLVVPGTTAQLGEQLSQDPASLAQVAAVTDGPFDATGRAGADRIFVNPHAFASLQPRGQQVVVTHESTHVAIRSTTDRPVPLWLSEGMADFVGYRDAGVSRQQVAAALLQRVRTGHGPNGPAVGRRLRPLTDHHRPELQRRLAGGEPHRRPVRTGGSGPLLSHGRDLARPLSPAGRSRREHGSGLRVGAARLRGVLHAGLAGLSAARWPHRERHHDERPHQPELVVERLLVDEVRDHQHERQPSERLGQ